MHEISLEELKKFQISILDSVVDFCDSQQINYWIDGGTLLGAIRHGGYIPWDDDIDLGMTRPNFDRFINEFNGFNERYIVKCIDTCSDFPYPYAKVLDVNTVLYEPDFKGNELNVNIDIFVYDNVPDDINIIEKLFKNRDCYRSLHEFQNSKHEPMGNIGRRILIKMLRKILLIIFPKNYFIKKISKNAKKYSNTKTTLVGNFLGWAKFCCRKEVFKGFLLHEFEGKQYKIPVGYDEWLTALYGDYMQLPPVEKRVSHHNFIAFYKD